MIALRAISDLGYAITHSDAGSETISFETGMSWRTWQGQGMTASVIANGLAADLIVGGAGKGAQLVQRREKERIARRVFAKVVELTPEIPEDAVTNPPVEPSPAAELERLAQLHRDGALTDDEFLTAKGKLLG